MFVAPLALNGVKDDMPLLTASTGSIAGSEIKIQSDGLPTEAVPGCEVLYVKFTWKLKAIEGSLITSFSLGVKEAARFVSLPFHAGLIGSLK